MLDAASLKIVVMAALALLVLWVMTRKRRDGFAPFAWYGYEGGEAPGQWGREIKPKRENYAPQEKSAVLKASADLPMAPLAVSSDLLPKAPVDSGFAQFAPDPSALTGQNFVDASRWVSMGTVGTHRNANYQLRADIPIPKNNAVSPWMQSTIEQDTYRKPLE